MKQLVAWLTLAVGVILSAMGLESFLLPNHFIDGGITGVSMLIAGYFEIPLAPIIVLVNVPFVFLGYRLIGRTFALKSSIAILALALCLAFLPYPTATDDKLLSAVFGGFFLGAGVGLAIRAGGVLDGTEILALILGQKTPATVGEIILLLNVVIFSVAAIVINIEAALYSMLTYFTASKTIDYLLHGLEAYNGVLIVTKSPDEVRTAILEQLGRGITTFLAKGGYSQLDSQVLFCVVTRLERNKLESLISSIDPTAFVVTLPVLDTQGGVVKRRAYH
ncbi:MAG: YitT family protein [Planctomycetota bacterium]|nr:YitT family protein [Planctomycetota bacterium]